MFLVNKNEMQNIDKYTIKNIGIPGIVLMENAGRKVFEFISRTFGPPLREKICVLAGTGNNGGDGLVIARHLINNRYNVKILLTAIPEKTNYEVFTNYNSLIKLKAQIYKADKKNISRYLKESTLIIDALLGTGLTRTVEGNIKNIIDLVNKSNKKVVSVDIPSGIDATNGHILGSAIKADYTVTIALPKNGLFLYPGNDYAGKISVVDISIPYNSKITEKIKNRLLVIKDVKDLLPMRSKNTHKGKVGKIFILAGSKQYIGAPLLTSSASLKTGSGLVYVSVPENHFSFAAKRLLEQIPVALPETEDGTYNLKSYNLILEKISKLKIDCIVIGPGLGVNKETSELVRKLLMNLRIPIVLDADGINSIKDEKSLLKKIKAPLVITPHCGELSRLINKKIYEIEDDRLTAVNKFTALNNSVLVLKGSKTLIGFKKNIFMNLTGNSGMATAGSGDVLSGMIGSLIGQGLNIFDSSKLGVFLHGRAGDISADKKGKMSLIASDIINNIPEAIKELKQNIDNRFLNDLIDLPDYFK